MSLATTKSNARDSDSSQKKNQHKNLLPISEIEKTISVMMKKSKKEIYTLSFFPPSKSQMKKKKKNFLVKTDNV